MKARILTRDNPIFSKSPRYLSVFFGALLLFLFRIFPSDIHAIHQGAGNLVCGACHTMHNSQGNTGLGGNPPGGSLILLRGPVNSKAEMHKFCLQCHASNGAMADIIHAPRNVAAPKVYSSGTWNDDTAFNMIGAGGNFSTELDANWNATTPTALGYGHSLVGTSVTPPGGDQAVPYLTCTNCHDPHGTNSASDTNINIFRNLKVNALNAGANSGVKFVVDPAYPYRQFKSYVGGVNGAYFGGSETDNAGEVIWSVYKGSLTGDPLVDYANSNAYGTGKDATLKTAGNGTMSLWCAQCHDNWHEAIATTNPGAAGDQGAAAWRWRRHTTNTVIHRQPQDPGDPWADRTKDRTNYSQSLIQAGRGVPVTASSYYANNAYYLPYEDPSPADYGNDDAHKVFCLSCHFAHGGPYYDNLRWDYNSAVSTGSQISKGISSDTGCRLCHYRLP